jgi:hypothetical protein
MQELIPIPVLTEEAEEVLRGCDSHWAGENDWPESFSFWAGGRSIDIKIQNGRGLTNDTTYRHYLVLFPGEKRAFFIESEGLQERRRVIERNLRSRGYHVEEKPSEWFMGPHKLTPLNN